MKIYIWDIAVAIGMVLLLASVLIMVESLFYSFTPHGETIEYTGFVIDVDYSNGGYMTSSTTYITFDDCVIEVLGTDNFIREGVNATITYQQGKYYDYFCSVEYLE